MNEHNFVSKWMKDVSRIEWLEFSDRKDALAEEYRVIHTQKPKWNCRANSETEKMLAVIECARKDMTARETARLVGISRAMASYYKVKAERYGLLDDE